MRQPKFAIYPTKAILEELEARQLYSAGIEGLAIVDPQLQPAINIPVEANNLPSAPADAAPASANRHELLLVDTDVKNYQELINGIVAQDDSGRDLEVVLLDKQEDGIAQISNVLANYKNLDAVHLISHGDDGKLNIGTTQLNTETLSQNLSQISAWGDAFNEDADFLIYGCNLAETGLGQQLINNLSTLTQTDVAASVDITGHTALGGNWSLEYDVGPIESQVAVNASGQQSWFGTLASYTVTNNNDSGAGSLRQAITDANNNPGIDTINFNIPGTNTHTITLNTVLPDITDQVILDATTDDSYANNSNRAAIVLDGNGLNGNGLTLAAGSGGSTIKGLSIINFQQYGLEIAASSNNNAIAGNLVGLGADGSTVTANGLGGIIIMAYSDGNTIGGTSAADRNVLSGNVNAGLSIQSSNNTVIGNYIGTDWTGTLNRGNNQDGIFISSGSNNVIGGINPTQRNIISGNNRQGIEIFNPTATGTVVQGNYIGTDVTGGNALGNGDGGIWLGMGTSGHTIGGTAAGAGNLIANNTAYANPGGVIIDNSVTSVSVLGNSFYNNTGLGIDLNIDGVTANDAGDADNGANNLQNFPVLTSARTNASNQLTLTGTLNSTANSYYRIEFFANTSQDGTGYGEGQRYLGFANVATDSSGNATISTTLTATVAIGEYISATATKSNSSYNTFTDTSEFAHDITATPISITVDTSNDTNDGDTTSLSTLIANKGADGFISLREAIIAANNTANSDGSADVIKFAIGSGSKVISLSSALPAITDAVTIDGWSQPGWSNRPLIILDANQLAAIGLEFGANADGSTIRGLVMRDFSSHAIQIDAGASNNTLIGNYLGSLGSGGTNVGVGEQNLGVGINVLGDHNIIGGTTAVERNVISGNLTGVQLTGAGANYNVVQGNYIGVDWTGATALANGQHGIYVTGGAQNNTLGGTVAGAGNVISGNTWDGIRMDSGPNTVQGNIIGLNAARTAVLANPYGIVNYDSNNTIGGATAGASNTISGNSAYGIWITGASSAGTTVQGNKIGTNVNGDAGLGNANGILIDGSATNTLVTSNIIANNAAKGIEISTNAGTGNALLGNAIYGNTGLGIDLDSTGVTANDAGDADTGANNLQNFPVLVAARTTGSQIKITGSINSAANTFFRIEFFANISQDGSGYGEGQTYLGYTNVKTDGSGNASFDATLYVNVANGSFISATATDLSTNTTSEFAQNIIATLTNTAPTFSGGTGKLTTNFGNDSSSNSVTVQSDGKIVVAGYASNGSNDDFALARYNSDGSLDTSFGSSGMLATDFSGYRRASAVTLQGDGKIVVAGSVFNGSNYDFTLVRYNSDGSLDPNFGSGGTITTNFGDYEYGNSATLQTDGKIVVAGYAYNGSAYHFALARYNTDGTLDTSFGGGTGKLTTNLGGVDAGNSVTLQADGKIVVAGYAFNGSNYDFALARYNSDGSLDASFGSGTGKLTTNFANNDFGNTVTVQADGKIVVAGYTDNGSNYDFALARYNSDGSLDTSFGGGLGMFSTDFGGNDSGYSLTLQADGKILVAGYASNGSNDNFALTRYNNDGSLDTSFGSGPGKLISNFGGNAQANSITVQADGKIVVAGYAYNGSSYDFALARYNSDGSLDASLGAVATLDGTPSYTENGAAVVLDNNVQVFDAELSPTNFNGATLTLTRNGGANSQDLFSATGTLAALAEGGTLVVGGTTIGTVTTNSGGTLVLTFNANATNALVNSAMHQIAYSNSSDTPPASVQIDWLFSDGNSGAQGTGGALAATGNTTVSIMAVNNAPIISNGNLVIDGAFENGGMGWTANGGLEVSSTPSSYIIPASPNGSHFVEVEGWNATGVASWIEQTITTVVGQTYQFTVSAVTRGGNTADAGVLSTNGTQVLSFVTTFSWADYTATFVATSTSTILRVTSAGSSSGIAPSAGDGFGLMVDNVRVIENAPVSFTESGSAVVMSPTAFLFDAELSALDNFNGSTLTLARNGGANTQDQFTNTGVLSSLTPGGNLVVGGTTIGTVTTNSGGTLVLTFNANATNALVNSAMQQIAYSNSSDAPPASVQIDWVFNDGNSGAQGTGGALSASGSTTVAITAVNDAPIFGILGSGKLITNFGGNDTGYSVTVQADGKIVVAGSAYNGSNTDFALVRYNSDGSLDTSFGGGLGMLSTDFGGDDNSYSVTVQADGKIVVAGYADNGSNIDFALARYNSDGSLDTSFGGGSGKLSTDFGSNDYGTSVTLQADGKIVVTGYADNGSNNDFALARFNSDGSLDTSFGGSGKLITNFGDNTQANSITVQADGKIVVAGSTFNGSNYDFALARYNSDGSLDTSFGSTGKLTTDFGGYDFGTSVTVQADGKIVVAGYAYNGSNYDFALLRYNSNGSLDTSFGGGSGKLTTDFGNYDYGTSVTVQANGKIVVAGQADNGSNSDFALVRYNSNGSLDTSFGAVGILDGTSSYTENGAAVVLDNNVQVFDAELSPTNFNGTTLTLTRNGGASSQDVFSASGSLSTLTQGGNLVVSGTTIGTVTTNSGGTLVLTFNANASNALVNSAMQQIAYSNSSDAPPASVQIHWTFNDGNSGAQGIGGNLAATGSSTVNITAMNDAPTGIVATHYLSDLSYTANTLYDLTLDTDHSGYQISLEGINYQKDLGTHPGSVGLGVGSVDFSIGGASNFKATIGINDYQGGNYGQVKFYVYVDGNLRFTSANISSITAPIELNIDTTGGTTLRLQVDNGNNGNAFDHAVWANARLEGGSVALAAIPEDSGNGTVIGSVVGVDADIPDNWSYSLTDSAGGRFAINPNNGQITVANASLLDFETAASNSITVRATDQGGLSYDRNFSLSLINVNEAPTSNPVSLTSIAEDSGARLITQTELLANANDVDGPSLTATNLTISSGNGSLLNNGNGTWTYTPVALDDTDVSFSYSVSDGLVTVTGSALMDITPINHIPAANTDTVYGDEDTPLTGNVLANDNDAEHSTLSAVLVTPPNHGSLVLNTDGSFNYTPESDWNGTDSFTYQAYDGNLYSNSATVSLNVAAVNDSPQAITDTISIAQGSQLKSLDVLAKASDVDGDVLIVIKAVALHGNVSINADGSLHYIPQTDFNGKDTITYTLSDLKGGDAEGIVSIEVIAANTTRPFVGPTSNPTGPTDVSTTQVTQTTETKGVNHPTQNPQTKPKEVVSIKPSPRQVLPKNTRLTTAGPVFTHTLSTSPGQPAIGNQASVNQGKHPESTINFIPAKTDFSIRDPRNLLKPTHFSNVQATALTDQELRQSIALKHTIDLMKNQMDAEKHKLDKAHIEIEFITGASVSLTAGFVTWILRGGALLSSLLSSVSLFKNFDPLAVVFNASKKTNHLTDINGSTDDQEQKLESMFDKSNPH